MLNMAKTTFLLLSLWAVGVSSSVVEKRLVPANQCSPKERLYHARVVYTFSNNSIINCGGTLIHQQWVITSSHCYGGRDGTLKVELITNPEKALKQQVNVIGIQSYSISDTDEPVLLLKLSEPSKSINPATLPSESCISPRDGDTLKVSGHGSEGGKDVKDLTCLDVSKERCKDLTETKFVKYNKLFCGEGTSKQEIKACKGDSGSGLLKKEIVAKSSIFSKEKEGDVLYGVLISGGDPCEDKFVFVDICAKTIRKWIKQTLESCS